jgi:hypothetical protein
MSEHKIKNGSFRVRMPDINRYIPESKYDNVEPVICNVQMLTQHDYADGWRQVVPRMRTSTKKYKDEKGFETIRHYSNAYKMKINLAQLPLYLWHRMQYADGDNYTVRNGMHHYLIEHTNVDSEIRELVNITNMPVCNSMRERVSELLNILKDNDVYGWVVIRAKSMYK